MSIITARKKPVEIECMLCDGNNWDETEKWCPYGITAQRDIGSTKDILIIDTLEGKMRCEVGDYIIKGVNGEFYPCKPDIFKKTYDVIGERNEN